MVIVVEEIVPIKIGDKQVGITVVVVVACGDRFGISSGVNVSGAAHFLEGAIALIVKKLAGPALISDEQVKISIIVHISPNGRLRGREWIFQASRARDVDEASMAIVVEQRSPDRKLPSTTHDENVGAAIVVVIGLVDVEAAELIEKAGLLRTVGECAVSIVVKEMHVFAEIHAGGDDVEKPVSIEVVDDYTTSHR